MNSTQPIPPEPSTDPDLAAAIDAWAPRGGSRPDVALEPRPDGLRVKLTYLGVETGVFFARGDRVPRPSVHATLDRLYDVLSWRVIRPPAGPV
jgi:hypothetical protein